MSQPELIVMLTKNDYTVENALEIFNACKDSKAKFWGAKESGLPADQLKNLYAAFRQAGKTSVMEVVAYDEEACLNGAKLAASCGCDILIGTLYFDSVNDFCKEHNLKYMPFVGKVTGRPSVLGGSVEEIVAEANSLLEKGVYGFDLLGYRYTGDAEHLNEAFVSRVDAPVCIAGSIDSYQRLDQMIKICPAFFTIGGAFFENKFGTGFCQQIDRVCDYISQATLTCV